LTSRRRRCLVPLSSSTPFRGSCETRLLRDGAIGEPPGHRADRRAPAEFGDDITTGLKRFLAAPAVTIAVSQPQGTPLFVLGMVGRPGKFPMSGPTTVVQAQAVAGGFREYAKTNEIVILRGQGRASTFVRVNSDRLVSGKDSSPTIPLEPGDTVLVP
jgi:polysaccharide biosynthesis/export protein